MKDSFLYYHVLKLLSPDRAKKHFSQNILILFVCAILIYGCATQKQVRKVDLRAKLDNAFRELESEEKKQGISKSEKQKYEEKELTQKPKLSDKSQALKEPDTKEPVNKEVTEFEEIGEGVASKYERNIDAEKRAEEDALSKALKKTGADIYYGFSDTLAQYGKTQYQFVAQYLYTWSSGLSTWERVGNPEFIATEDGGTKCKLKIKGKIYSKGSPDPNYEIRLDLKDEKLGFDKPAYYSGDEVKLSFWTTKDSYITILNVDEEQNVSLIYPNKFSESALVKAGSIFTIPDNSAIALKVILPEGRTETIELLHIIATKKEPLFLPEETKEIFSGEYKISSLGDLKKVIERLAKLNRSDWTSIVLPYTIKSR